MSPSGSIFYYFLLLVSFSPIPSHIYFLLFSLYSLFPFLLLHISFLICLRKKHSCPGFPNRSWCKGPALNPPLLLCSPPPLSVLAGWACSWYTRNSSGLYLFGKVYQFIFEFTFKYLALTTVRKVKYIIYKPFYLA